MYSNEFEWAGADRLLVERVLDELGPLPQMLRRIALIALFTAFITAGDGVERRSTAT